MHDDGPCAADDLVEEVIRALVTWVKLDMTSRLALGPATPR